MRSLHFALVAACLTVTSAFASPIAPKPGVEYTLLSPAQSSQTVGKKVEVIEIFMYHCPYCHALEPILEQWVKKQGDNIIFKRLHMPSQGPGDPEAHLFLTLQAMGKNEEYQSRIMDAESDIVKRKRSEKLTEQEVLEVASKLPGIDKARLMDTWNSFGVKSMLNRAPGIVFNNYKVETVPTIVVDGKYVTSPGLVGETAHVQSQQQLFQQTLQVVDALITKVQNAK